MANYSANDRSERILQSRRFTTDALGLSQEAFTSVLDISSYEIYTDDGLIPSASNQLPFSGSSQGGLIVSASHVDPTNYTEGVNDLPILKYYYRHRLKRGAATEQPEEQVFYFTEEEATTSGGGQFVSDNQLIESDQLTNFISPKYLEVAGDTVNVAETGNPGGAGYKVVVYISDSTTASGITEDAADPTTYVFDYKTGVLSWKAGSTPTSTKHIYMTAYRYVGRTLRSQIDDGTIGGGGVSNVSFHISASEGTGFDLANNATASFESGSSGITVTAGTLNKITIGANTDNVTFNSITSSLFGTSSVAEKVFLAKAETNANRPIILSQTVTANGPLSYVSGAGFASFTYNTITSELKINGTNASDELSISTSSISAQSGISSYDIINTNVSTLNIGGAATTINMGSANGTVSIAGSASIAGDLIVQGAVTSINTTELNVEDQFILLNSGSTTLKDSGIIVSSGPGNSGSAFYYDADSNRWALTPKNTTLWNATSATPKQYVVSVSASAAAPPTDPLDFGTTSEYYGMMHVNTDTGDIYIYS